MALDRPQLRYARADEVETDTKIERALDLARQLEAVLEETPSIAIRIARPHDDAAELREPESRPLSTRMARAMAASLVDELEALTRGKRSQSAAS